MEFLIQNVLTAVPLPAQIREQIIEDTLKGAPPAKYAWPEKGMLEDISSAVLDICVPTLVLAARTTRWKRSICSSGRWSLILKMRRSLRRPGH